MLENTLAPELAPGTNARGGLACPPWWFLLDRLDPGRVLLAGPVDERDRRWLREHAAEVVSAAPDLAAGPFDVVVAGAGVGSEVIAGLLAPEGQAFVDGDVDIDGDGGDGDRSTATLALTPAGGRMVTAVPAADTAAAAWLADQPATAGAPGRLTRHLPGRIRRRLPAPRPGTRAARLLPTAPTPAGPPAWLAAAAAEAGLDVTGHGWALWARGDYPSQKAVVFLFAPGAGQPELVVKVTKDGRFNGRLRNEVAALERVGGLASVAARGPQVRFSGEAGGLAFAGESMVLGRPFVEASTLDPGCAIAADAVSGITDLGRSTARDVDPALAAGPLAELLVRYTELFAPDADQRRVLEAQVEAVARAERFPAVLHHGDLGTWNVVVGDSGSVTFLDWEAAEEPGPPLWDLFYFLRSFVVQSSRRRRVRNRLRAASDDLLAVTPVSRSAAGWVAAYRTAVGVPAELVEPLFHCCWMHRAVKEATRIGPGRRGHYAELSGLLVDRRADPGLRLLLTGEDHG